MNTLSKEEWIAELARLLCLSQGAETDHEKGNCRGWAESVYEAELEAAGTHEDIDSPMEAHNTELSYG